MEPLWEHVGDHGLAVCSNGGIVYDVAAHAVRSARPIPPDVGLAVAARPRDAVPGTAFAVEKTSGFGKEPGFMPRRAQPAGMQVGDPGAIFGHDTVKLLARHEERDPEEFWAQTEALVGDVVTTTWSSVGALVEISGAGVTKASTLALLCAELGVAPDEV